MANRGVTGTAVGSGRWVEMRRLEKRGTFWQFKDSQTYRDIVYDLASISLER